MVGKEPSLAQFQGMWPPCGAAWHSSALDPAGDAQVGQAASHGSWRGLWVTFVGWVPAVFQQESEINRNLRGESRLGRRLLCPWEEERTESRPHVLGSSWASPHVTLWKGKSGLRGAWRTALLPSPNSSFSAPPGTEPKQASKGARCGTPVGRCLGSRGLQLSLQHPRLRLRKLNKQPRQERTRLFREAHQT